MSSRRGILLVLFLIFLAIGISLVGSLLLFAVSAAPASIPPNATLYLKIKAPFNEILNLHHVATPADTAVIMVHPWGIDDGQGWRTPEPAGVCDFCTPEKNHLAARHTKEIISPFHKSLRGKTAFQMYSLPGKEDPIRKKLYRSIRSKPSDEDQFLTMFGKPMRLLTCECERSSETSMGQAFHLSGSGAFIRIPRGHSNALIAMEGGSSIDRPCEAHAHHGFFGVEKQTVDRINAWMLEAK